MDSDDRTSTAERNGRVVLSWQPAGRTRQAITVSEGGECISVDKIDLLVEKERQRLATRIAQKTKQPQGKVLAALAQFAAEVLEAQRQAAEADDDQGKQPASTLQGEEIRLSWPEPWPEAVDLAAVLDEIVATIRRYILMTAAQADAVALWLCWSYSVDDFDAAPLLVVNSPVKRCGKTTLGRIVAKIAPRTLAASGISPAALYRVIQEVKPTLICDEFDGNPELEGEIRSIINSGHTRDLAFVVRCVGDNHQARRFSTWGAKALLGIGKLPSTVSDRSIIITLQRKPPGAQVERLTRRALKGAADLARKLMRWREDNAQRIDGDAEPPDIPACLNDRQVDCWTPLFILADLAGSDWPRRARQAAIELSGGDAADENDLAIRLLADIHHIFDETGWGELTTTELLDRLAGIEDAPWATLSRGKPITAHRLARMLKPFGIQPVHRKAGSIYHREAFSDAFSRYIPIQTVTLSPSDVKPDQIRI